MAGSGEAGLVLLLGEASPAGVEDRRLGQSRWGRSSRYIHVWVSELQVVPWSVGGRRRDRGVLMVLQRLPLFGGSMNELAHRHLADFESALVAWNSEVAGLD